MRMYKTKVHLPDGEKCLVVVNHNEETGTATQSKTVEKLHHIHIIDRSLSMSSEIDRLVDNVQKTFEIIGDDDLVSIIWFSSPGQFRTLVKGANKSDNLTKLLDSMRRCIGTTCFSDPIRETGVIVNELNALCPNISVTLFTDGCPVVPWGEAEEVNKCVSLIKEMASSIVAFNTVGYGYWYNQDMLKAFSECSEFGEMVHSSQIDQYLDIFSRNFEKISEMVFESVSVSGPESILYMNRKFTKMAKAELALSRLDKNKNQFFITGDGDFTFEVNDVEYNAGDIKGKVPKATLANFYYALAYEMYYSGKRKDALDILAKNLRDKLFVDNQFSAFTYDETAVHVESLRKAVFSTKFRLLDGECPKNYLPADDALCVMDVLGTLSGSDNCFYIPFGENVAKYNRTTRKTVDEFNLFTRTDKEVRAPFSDFVYNKKFMNLSIRFTVPGTVALNPVAAKRVGLPVKVDSSIWRNHSIITDGVLNTKNIEVLLDDATFHGVMDKDFCVVIGTDGDYFRCVLELDKLPVINRSYINNSTDIKAVFDNTLEIIHLEARQKVLKWHTDKVYDALSIAKKEAAFKEYTMDQIRVLEEHGLDKNMNYKGVANKTATAAESDSYETRTMEFYIKGCSSLPKIDDVIKKIGGTKPLTTVQKIVADELELVRDGVADLGLSVDDLNTKTKSVLEACTKDTKARLAALRGNLAALKMAKILTGDWFEGLEVDDKGNYLYTVGDITMIARVDRVTQYI